MTVPAASHSRDLTDEQWVLIEPFLPKLTRRKDGRGRPWRENRAVLNGVLWILRTGGPWADLPDRYPSYQTCHRRFPNGFDRRSVAGYRHKIRTAGFGGHDQLGPDRVRIAQSSPSLFSRTHIDPKHCSLSYALCARQRS